MKQFALAGNPNCGKTTLFNLLTGSTAYVGNWPGVTVDKKVGTYKRGEEKVEIVDLPGIYSLSPYTPEEVVSRNFILEEKPACVINIVDATNLERNLYLTTQLMEIDVPIVIALNMMDAVEKSGDVIDAKLLEQKIGLPVVTISALKGTGIKELMDRAISVSKKGREGETVLRNSPIAHLVQDVNIALRAQGVGAPLFHAIKLSEMDEIETAMHPELVKMVDEFKATFKDDVFGTDLEAVVADARYKYISANYSSAYQHKEGKKEGKLTGSDRADKVLTHRVWGIPIFIVILFAIFHLTFAEDLFFINALSGGNLPTLFGAVEEGGLGLEENGATTLLACFYDGAVFSPGVMLTNLLNWCLDWINVLAEMACANAPGWVGSFVLDGVLSGVFAVLGFIPQILTLFLFFSILEDTGYMARIAFILDRIFRKFGLSGRAFMPMIMGFGCSVPAFVNTRTLADEKERISTIRVIPFFSCGAKLPILTAVAGAIIAASGVGNADLITLCMYLLGMIVAIIAVVFMRSTTMRGEVPPFIMELPAYHLPRFSSLMIHLWDKAKHYVKKAFTIILVSTIIVWFLSSFSWNWQFILQDAQELYQLYANDPTNEAYAIYASLEEVQGLVNMHMDQSILGSIGMLIQPLFTPLGFGSQLGTSGWVFAVAAITGLVAKENVIATFGTLASAVTGAYISTEEGIAEVSAMISATNIAVPALIAFIAFNMLTIPCFAACATARAELPKGRFKWTLLFWVATSYIVSMMIYLIGSFWWTAFIFAALIVAAIVAIAVWNKKHPIMQQVAQSSETKTESGQ